MKSTYDQLSYLLPLAQELQAAECYIGYLTPFLSKTAIDIWEPVLCEKIANGVRVCIFVEKPEDWDNPFGKESDESHRWLLKNMRRLERMGAHVTMVQHFHQKVLVIDYRVVWSGSINFLSSDPHKRTEKVDRDDDFLQATNAYFRFNFERCTVCEHIEWSAIRGAKVLDINELEGAKTQKDIQKNGDGAMGKLKSQSTSHPSGQQETKVDDVDDEPLLQWITTIRKSTEVSSRKFAEFSKVDRKSLRGFESGVTIPPIRILIKLLNALGYDLVIVPKDTTSLIRKIAKSYCKSEARKMIAEKKLGSRN